MRIVIAALLGVIAVVGGFACGIGTFAYGIWLIVLMAKGTMAATFGNILCVIACWMGAGVVGWIWGLFWGFLAGMVGGAEFEKKKSRRLW